MRRMLYRLIFRYAFVLVGYLYLRLRYGKYHKRRLIIDFASEYEYAGLTIIGIPVLILIIVAFSWALIHVGIFLLS